MTTTYAGQSVKSAANIRKAVTGGVHIAALSVDALTQATLFSTTTGVLAALPVGYHDLGYLTTDGAKFSESLTTSEIDSWQAVDPTRTDITKDTVTLTFECQETNIHTLAIFTGIAESTFSTTPDAGGSFEVDKPLTPAGIYYRVAVFGVDEDDDGETIICRFLPRARVTDFSDQTFANGDSPITYGLTLTAFQDTDAGYSSALFVGGDGWKAKAVASGFTLGT